MTDLAAAQQKAPDLRSEIAQAAQSLPAEATALLVTDTASFAAAGAMLRRVRALRDKLSEWMDPQIENAKATKAAAERARKGLCDDKELLDGPLLLAEQALAAKLGAYEDEQERARVAAEERLRLALAAQADERALADAIALEEAALMAPTREEGAQLFAEAEAVLNEPVQAAPITLARTTPKVAGLSRPEQVSAEVVDQAKLLRALLDGKLERALAADLTRRIAAILPTPMMNDRAKSLRQALDLPGVRARVERGYRMRS